MTLAIVLIAVALLVIVGLVLIRRAGGGRFPWLQFYLRGRESGFAFREINLIRRVAVEARLEDPTALFWSVKQLDRAVKGFIIKYRSRGEEDSPEYNLLLAKLFELRKKVEFDLPKYKLGVKSSRKLMKGQVLRITLPGAGPFASKLIENLVRYMAIEYPRGPRLPDGFTWKSQKIGVYFWRAEDAGYFFQTKVIDDYQRPQVPHPAHRPRRQPRAHPEAAGRPGRDRPGRGAVPAAHRRGVQRDPRAGQAACAAGWSTSPKAGSPCSSAARRRSACP